MMKVSLEKLETFLLEEFQNKITLLRNSFEADLLFYSLSSLAVHLSRLSLTL